MRFLSTEEIKEEAEDDLYDDPRLEEDERKLREDIIKQ
jgi:hypothetical protein